MSGASTHRFPVHRLGAPYSSGRWTANISFSARRPDPAPDSLTIVSVDPQKGTYIQHYFDSRGVTRLYAMTFNRGTWTLRRQTPDFSPLDFHQRFIGRFTKDGTVIKGAWEASGDDGSSWRLDFELTYTRLSRPLKKRT